VLTDDGIKKRLEKEFAKAFIVPLSEEAKAAWAAEWEAVAPKEEPKPVYEKRPWHKPSKKDKKNKKPDYDKNGDAYEGWPSYMSSLSPYYSGVDDGLSLLSNDADLIDDIYEHLRLFPKLSFEQLLVDYGDIERERIVSVLLKDPGLASHFFPMKETSNV
jgi:hypothetical protein